MAERKRRHGKLYLLLMALAAAGAAIWVGSSVLSVEEFAFTGARLPAGWDGGRLVVLSDLHGKRFGRQHSRLLEAVRKAGPDVICLCGDMMDEWSGTEYLRPLLEGLAEIAPVYYVTGNHEWASGRMPEMRQLLEETGVTYLSNTFVPLERNGIMDNKRKYQFCRKRQIVRKRRRMKMEKTKQRLAGDTHSGAGLLRRMAAAVGFDEL